MTLMLLALLYRVCFLQCTDQKEYNDRKRDQLRSTVKVEAKRGQICDRRGSILALSTTSPMLWCDPKVVTDPQEETKRLAEVVEINYEDVMKRMSSTNLRYSIIKKGLTDTEHDKIIPLISLHQARKEARLSQA